MGVSALPALARTMIRLVESNDADGIKALHDSGEWTDLEMVAQSAKAPDGKTWYCSALA